VEPQTDKFAVAKYSSQDLAGKQKCKQDLLTASHQDGRREIR